MLLLHTCVTAVGGGEHTSSLIVAAVEVWLLHHDGAVGGDTRARWVLPICLREAPSGSQVVVRACFPLNPAHPSTVMKHPERLTVIRLRAD